MLRGKTVLAVADLYAWHFERVVTDYRRARVVRVAGTALRDYLLDLDYEDAWLNWALSLDGKSKGTMKEAIIASRTNQAGLIRLTEDILRAPPTFERTDKELVERVIRSVELDGYRFDGQRLRATEEKVFEVEEAAGVLRALYRACGLPRYDQVDRDLQGSEDHYANGVWGDSIKRARDVLEVTLFEIARARTDAARVPDTAMPRDVRRVLNEIGFHDEAEHRFSGALYGLVSDQGGHPNMSERENALLCRQHVLTAVHFALLRHQTLTGAPSS